LKNLKAPREFHFEFGKTVNLSKVKYAFFTGPRTFVVDRDGIKLRLRFRFIANFTYENDPQRMPKYALGQN
jgi:hypothetical protein